MPHLHPAEFWQAGPRWAAAREIMYRADHAGDGRRGPRDPEFVLGPTHEEIITPLVKSELTSYRDLPKNFYQIATKFRNEIRPRYGLMRAREFVMKDAYSFDVDDEAATRIVLADNRTADKATYDNEILLEVLGRVKTLEGTGFDADDVGDLEKGGSGPGAKQPKVKFKVGEYSFSTTEEIYEDWATGLALPDDALARLGIPVTSVVTEGR